IAVALAVERIVGIAVGLAIAVEVAGAEGRAGVAAPSAEPDASAREAAARRRRDPRIAVALAVDRIVAVDVGLAIAIEVAGAEGRVGVAAPRAGSYTSAREGPGR